MSKKNKHRTPGIPASAAMAVSKEEMHTRAVADVPKVMGVSAPNLEPPHAGTIRFEHDDGKVEHMKYWHGPEGAHVASAAASLEG